MNEHLNDETRERIAPPKFADSSWIEKKELDICYANRSDAQKLDIYYPAEKKENYPAVLFIHGGAFGGGDKQDAQIGPFLQLVKYGYAVVGINYRLSGEAVFPEGIQDCKAAVRFIKANAEKYHIDADNLALAGNSSGANFALMVAASEGVEKLEDKTMGNPDYDTKVKCVVSWFAPTDFLQMNEMLIENGLEEFANHEDEDAPECVYLRGGIRQLDYDFVQSANPMTYITPELPPVFMQHGRIDFVVPYQQSVIFAEKANEICGDGRVELEILEGANHADPMFETDENMKKVADYLKRYI